MPINKIINGYFAFVMAVSAVALLNYNSDINKYFQDSYASVIHTMEALGEDGNMGIELVNAQNVLEPKISEDPIFVKNNGVNFVNFEISEGDGYAKAGDKGVKAMVINIKSNQKVVLNGLRLKLAGKGVLAGYLYNGEELISEGKNNGEYLNFPVKSSVVDQSLWIALDLDQSLVSGDRIRLDIEKAEDLKALVADKSYVLPGYYPIKGGYISVVGR